MRLAISALIGLLLMGNAMAHNQPVTNFGMGEPPSAPSHIEHLTQLAYNGDVNALMALMRMRMPVDGGSGAQPLPVPTDERPIGRKAPGISPRVPSLFLPGSYVVPVHADERTPPSTYRDPSPIG